MKFNEKCRHPEGENWGEGNGVQMQLVAFYHLQGDGGGVSTSSSGPSFSLPVDVPEDPSTFYEITIMFRPLFVFHY